MKPYKSSWVGRKFGRLTVLMCFRNDSGAQRALCRCDCGVEREVAAGNLASGATLSCGCLNSDNLRALAVEAELAKQRRDAYRARRREERRQVGESRAASLLRWSEVKPLVPGDGKPLTQRELVLSMLAKGPVSACDVEAQTHIAMSTASAVLCKLTSDGKARVAGVVSSPSGRAVRLYEAV